MGAAVVNGTLAAPSGRTEGFVVCLPVVDYEILPQGRLCRFAGLGIADILLGVAVSVLKYLLILSALFSAFDKLNADYALVGPRTVGQSKCYEPVLRLSEAVFPFLEWVGDRVPQRDE